MDRTNEVGNLTNPVTPKVRRNKLTTVADQVVHAYNVERKTIREIGNYFGCSEGTVRNMLIIKGVAMRPRGRRKTVTNNEGE